jgi:hypothetical protein
MFGRSALRPFQLYVRGSGVPGEYPGHHLRPGSARLYVAGSAIGRSASRTCFSSCSFPIACMLNGAVSFQL